MLIYSIPSSFSSAHLKYHPLLIDATTSAAQQCKRHGANTPHPTRPGRRGSHTTARELQTCTFERPSASNTPKIPREDPQRGKKRTNFAAGQGKKARNFGPPTLRAPPFGPPPFGPPPFGPPPFGPPPFGPPTLRAPTFSGLGPHPSNPHPSNHHPRQLKTHKKNLNN